MARINIEECWWSDPRRTKLLLKIGFAADAAAVNMWRTAQEFWGKGRALVPKDVFDKLEYSSELIECGLADIRESFIYVRGSSEHHEWVLEKRDQAREAGLASAESRRKKHGSAQPKGGKGNSTTVEPESATAQLRAEITEREPNENRTEPNGTEPSYSSSSSKRNNTYTQKFEEIWAMYPVKGRINKANAFKRYRDQIKTVANENDLLLGVTNYVRYLSVETWRNPKQFDTFLGTDRSGFFWQQFVEPDPLMLSGPVKPVTTDSFCGIGEP